MSASVASRAVGRPDEDDDLSFDLAGLGPGGELAARPAPYLLEPLGQLPGDGNVPRSEHFRHCRARKRARRDGDFEEHERGRERWRARRGACAAPDPSAAGSRQTESSPSAVPLQQARSARPTRPEAPRCAHPARSPRARLCIQDRRSKACPHRRSWRCAGPRPALPGCAAARLRHCARDRAAPVCGCRNDPAARGCGVCPRNR